jgi:hypothetical protein
MVWLLNGVGVSMIMCALTAAQNSAMAGRVMNPSMFKSEGIEADLRSKE